MSDPQGTHVPSIRLGQIALARSGDKGNHANIGVVAYTAAGYDYLQRALTAERVTVFFSRLGVTRVVRYELPRLYALNFVLYDVLAGGASRSLRIDTQGKLLGTAILELELPLPEHVSRMVRPRQPCQPTVSSAADATKLGRLPASEEVAAAPQAARPAEAAQTDSAARLHATEMPDCPAAPAPAVGCRHAGGQSGRQSGQGPLT
jgi:hypothetical protein